VLLRAPSRAADAGGPPRVTTIERMEALVDVAQADGFDDAEVRKGSLRASGGR
jgi:hypothetical protein